MRFLKVLGNRSLRDIIQNYNIVINVINYVNLTMSCNKRNIHFIDVDFM